MSDPKTAMYTSTVPTRGLHRHLSDHVRTLDFCFDPDDEPAEAEDAGRCRRVPIAPGTRGGPVDHRRPHRVGPGVPGGQNVADAPEHQRMENGAELAVPPPSGLVPVLDRDDRLHRARKSLGETLL